MKTTYQTMLEQFQALSAKYSMLPLDSVLNAYDTNVSSSLVM